jgi:hypothetical protein
LSRWLAVVVVNAVMVTAELTMTLIQSLLRQYQHWRVAAVLHSDRAMMVETDTRNAVIVRKVVRSWLDLANAIVNVNGCSHSRPMWNCDVMQMLMVDRH